EEAVSLQDYEVKDIMLGKPTQDTSRQMMTMGVKEVLRYMEQDEIEIRTLQRQVEIDLTSVANLGVGHSKMAFTFSESILRPSGDITNPK
ncbi:hypothetical protein, partial [Enterobacter hormaechei]|uniref:hypothetical protein n=1 Tax=Enterobacter hormaechei TaxID=158836 RepID=UPI0023E3D266